MNALNERPPFYRNILNTLLTARGIKGWLAIGLLFFAIDLCWLGLVAQPIYADLLGDLKAPEPYWPAAIAFYLFYITTIFGYGVVNALSVRDALTRGASLGFVAYATYELTNWAVIRDWPALLVPMDILWGVVLTSTVAGLGYRLLTPKGDL